MGDKSSIDQDNERRRLLRLIERARLYEEAGYTRFFEQGAGMRFQQSLGDERARGVPQVVALARLRQNPGLIGLH